MSSSRDTWRSRLRASNNPYAYHFFCDSEDSDGVIPQAAPPAPVASKVQGLSKSDFEAECRSIFRRYMPKLESAKLRTHYQEFIQRNLARSAEARFAVLNALRRYDLSSEPGLQPYFNREEDAFTQQKLLQIEKSITIK